MWTPGSILPAPLGPRMPSTLPFRTVKEISRVALDLIEPFAQTRHAYRDLGDRVVGRVPDSGGAVMGRSILLSCPIAVARDRPRWHCDRVPGCP